MVLEWGGGGNPPLLLNPGGGATGFDVRGPSGAPSVIEGGLGRAPSSGTVGRTFGVEVQSDVGQFSKIRCARTAHAPRPGKVAFDAAFHRPESGKVSLRFAVSRRQRNFFTSGGAC